MWLNPVAVVIWVVPVTVVVLAGKLMFLAVAPLAEAMVREGVKTFCLVKVWLVPNKAAVSVALGMVTPFIDVAVATPRAGVTKVGDVENTTLVVLVPVVPVALAR